MGHFRRWVPSLFVVAVIFAFVVEVRGDYGEDETSHKCGGGKYDLTKPYAMCINQLVNDVARLTPTHGYNYVASSNYMGTNCYGYGACDRVLSSSECDQCISDANNNLFDKSECKFRVTGEIKLAKCRMGYQDSPVTQT